jgi:hypothetical protein
MQFVVRRVINAGYVGRDQATVLAHIEELQREGIPPPPAVPMLFPLPGDTVTTADRIEVTSGQTSGEVEYVLLLNKGEILVGVGSDHTDRWLERHSLVKSKQLCKNVVSRQVWRYRDLRARWDGLVLQSFVRDPGTDTDILYQQAPLRSILSADTLLDMVRTRLRDADEDGLVIFSGTLSLLTERPHYGGYFRGELIDPRSEQRLSCEYRTVRLDYLDGVSDDS